jgi:ribosome-binding factor A
MSRHRRGDRTRGIDPAGKSKSPRQLRVGEELRHALAQVIERGEMRDPDLQGVSVTVTEIDASPDLRNAIAFIVPLGGHDAERVLAAMRRAAPFFRSRLAKMVDLRFAPELRFELDRSFDSADRIGALLRLPDVRRDLDEDEAAPPAKRRDGDEPA